MEQPALKKLALWLKALSEPKRLQLFDMIARGYQCNCQLGDELGLPANLISHHLGVLRDAGLIESERDPLDARWVYYSVNLSALKAASDALGAFLDLERIQPRRLTCGPQAVSAHSNSLAKKAEAEPA